MPKKTLERSRASTGSSFFYDGETYEYGPGRRLPAEYIFYAGEYATIRELIYDLVRYDNRVKERLKLAMDSPDIATRLHSVIEGAAPRRSETVLSALAALPRMSAADLSQIVSDLFRDRYVIPERMPQWTFQEARNTCFALAQGRVDGSLWQPVPGELAVCYRCEGDPLEVKFVPSTWFRDITSINRIHKVLTSTELKLEAVLVFQILLNAVIDEGEVTLELDSIIQCLGWKQDSHDEKVAVRGRLWRWICIFDSLHVIGRRRGFIKVEGLPSDGRLLEIENALWEMGKFESTFKTPPIDVILKPGEWLNRFRKNRSVLPNIGDIIPLTSLMAGKRRGSWALSMGLALNQLWRQGALTFDLEGTKDPKPASSALKEYSRNELFAMFPPDASLEDILDGPHPQRAKKYWAEAIKLLRKCRVIDRCQDKTSVFADRRVGWGEYWKDQRVLIVPNQETLSAIASIQKPKKKPPVKSRPGGSYPHT
jgi:hypothetical protein